MPRPLHERGFEVKGELPPYEYIYEINKSGGEVITVKKIQKGSGLDDFIKIWVSEGTVKMINAETCQAGVVQTLDFESRSNKPEIIKLYEVMGKIIPPKKIREINYSQAMQFYEKVKQLLNVEKRLKEYVPRFSSETELTLINILGLDDLDDLGKTKREE